MRRVRSPLVGAALLGLVALGACGCLFRKETVGSGDSARSWEFGKLIRVYNNVSYDKVWTAASAAVREMKLTVEGEPHDALVGSIKFRRADNITGRVDLDNLGEKQTRVTIRVGAIGRDRDKQAAMTLMDAIDKKLGK